MFSATQHRIDKSNSVILREAADSGTALAGRTSEPSVRTGILRCTLRKSRSGSDLIERLGRVRKTALASPGCSRGITPLQVRKFAVYLADRPLRKCAVPAEFRPTDTPLLRGGPMQSMYGNRFHGYAKSLLLLY